MNVKWQTIRVRVPLGVKRRLDAAAKSRGMLLDAYVGTLLAETDDRNTLAYPIKK